MNILPFVSSKKKGEKYTQWIGLALVVGLIIFLVWWFLIRKKAPVVNPGYGGGLDPNAGGNNTGGTPSSPVLLSSVSTATDALYNSIDGWLSSAESKNDAAAKAYGFSNAQIVALANDWATRYAPTYGSGLYTAMDNEINVPYFTVGTNYWEILKERLKDNNATF